jgi:hypothetical protein
MNAWRLAITFLITVNSGQAQSPDPQPGALIARAKSFELATRYDPGRCRIAY